MQYPWQVTSQKVQAVIKKIVTTIRPRKIILFGSYIQGNVGKHSDLDILIITRDDIISPRQESIRIRRALKEIFMPMDILVVTESKFEELKNMPGLVYREAVNTGEVVYDSEKS